MSIISNIVLVRQDNTFSGILKSALTKLSRNLLGQYACAKAIKTVMDIVRKIRPAGARDPEDVRPMAGGIPGKECEIEKGTHAV